VRFGTIATSNVTLKMNVMMSLGAIANVMIGKCLGSSKEGLIIPVFGMTWGRPMKKLGPIATMLPGFI
jgi:hypothetical protein